MTDELWARPRTMRPGEVTLVGSGWRYSVTLITEIMPPGSTPLFWT